jgi:hypothetical protein
MGGRQFSPWYGLADAGHIALQTIVQASAAFPPLIPPVKHRPMAVWGLLTETLEKGPHCIAHTEAQQLWLTDGGAYNNFGTDWRGLRKQLHHCEFAYRRAVRKLPEKDQQFDTTFQEHTNRYGQVHLVVDAQQNMPRVHLSLLHIPVIRTLLYMGRVIKVLYDSTLNGRSQNAFWNNRVITNNPETWSRLRFQGAWTKPQQKFDPEKNAVLAYGEPAVEVYVPYSYTTRQIQIESGGSAFFTRLSHQRLVDHMAAMKEAAKNFGALWPDHPDFYRVRRKFVDTTFNSLGRENTLHLVFAGYLNTRESLYMLFDFKPLDLPCRKWFEALIQDE